MKLTFADHFQCIADRLSTDLLAEPARTALLTLCSEFPYDIASDFGFESRLAEPAAVCDFFLLIRRSSEGAAMIAGESQIAGLPDTLKNHPFWVKLSALFCEWNQPDSFLHRHVHSFWLEFDFEGGSYNKVPNIFFQVKEELNPEEIGRWNEGMETALNQIYQILFGICFPDNLACVMRTCVESLPSGAVLYQTGFMIPRKTEAVRLVISRLRPDAMTAYLGQIGWPGDITHFNHLHSRYLPHFLYAIYDLTIGNSILPRLDTELFFNHTRQPQWEPAWHKVFDLLLADGLLLEEKRKGLTDWCGKRAARGIFPGTYYNGINHLKLVFHPGGTTECKGYFGTMIIKNKPGNDDH